MRGRSLALLVESRGSLSNSLLRSLLARPSRSKVSCTLDKGRQTLLYRLLTVFLTERSALGSSQEKLGFQTRAKESTFPSSPFSIYFFYGGVEPPSFWTRAIERPLPPPIPRFPTLYILIGSNCRSVFAAKELSPSLALPSPLFRFSWPRGFRRTELLPPLLIFPLPLSQDG